jgi:hypothetical protein
MIYAAIFPIAESGLLFPCLLLIDILKKLNDLRECASVVSVKFSLLGVASSCRI